MKRDRLAEGKGESVKQQSGLMPDQRKGEDFGMGSQLLFQCMPKGGKEFTPGKSGGKIGGRGGEKENFNRNSGAKIHRTSAGGRLSLQNGA